MVWNTRYRADTLVGLVLTHYQWHKKSRLLQEIRLQKEIREWVHMDRSNLVTAKNLQHDEAELYRSAAGNHEAIALLFGYLFLIGTLGQFTQNALSTNAVWARLDRFLPLQVQSRWMNYVCGIKKMTFPETTAVFLWVLSVFIRKKETSLLENCWWWRSEHRFWKYKWLTLMYFVFFNTRKINMYHCFVFLICVMRL